ncbi:Syntaxin-binding protein 5-like [Dissostichus eleginoides]|uniref:Syntaxin-binding protein 5-like n=1 Tax=Dissostichus eleginoides TaxID=100907 RepID=A0AAD9FHW1_DISEL|nr:Syntaxin-binding protein 5-like [Dissostichus eleginoides]
MKKFRKVLDGLTTSSPGGTMGSPSSGSAAGTPTMAPTPKEIDIQETLVSENFQMCKSFVWALITMATSSLTKYSPQV